MAAAQRGATADVNDERDSVLGFIAIVTVGLFVAIWIWILILAANRQEITGEFVVAAGAVSTLLASITSAAIGSKIADVKNDQSDPDLVDGAAAMEQVRAIVTRHDQAMAEVRSVDGQAAPTGTDAAARQQRAADQAHQAEHELAALVSPSSPTVSLTEVAHNLNWRVIVAIVFYVLVGLAVLVVWLVLDWTEDSPDIVTTFALSIVGWFVGAAGIVFEGGRGSK
ncbi:hypothetical protein ET445_14560 [Agromyces protaetiae]|uniref:Uncharacterized protein n=1 Tax=Agromyces protaetiae TaxID=2509455 RepID=A0A4P6FIH5_9MICO|nr:hypothetical protein [Agromyces protaetiae]QAY74369.1 hypothetical protein ET445_14560 [Agromyces protaetiae]